MTDCREFDHDEDVPEQVATSAWIDGDDLVMLPEAILPLVCLRCGMPATRYVTRQVARRSSVFCWVAAHLLSPLAFLNLETLPTIPVVIPVCDEHQRHPPRPKLDPKFAPLLSPWFIRFSGVAAVARVFREASGDEDESPGV